LISFRYTRLGQGRKAKFGAEREGMWKLGYTVNKTRKEKTLRLVIECSDKVAFMAIVQYTWGQKCLIFAT
jgi:hypothetical protein